MPFFLSVCLPGAETRRLLRSTLVRTSGAAPFAHPPGRIFSLANRWLALPRRFAGPMERLQAEAELINRVNSTYLVRHRSREYTEYAISIR